ncbi:hypothetical protein [Rhodocaloribacter sp.]
MRFLLPSVLAVLLTGCAMHAPVSETFVFHDPIGARPAYGPGFKLGGAFAVNPGGRGFVAEEVERRTGGKGRVVNPRQRGFGVYLAHYGEGEAVALTVGRGLLGADATARLWGRTYLTMSGSVYGGYRVIVHRRLLHTPHASAALGLAVRRDFHFYEIPQRTERRYLFPDYENYMSLPVTSFGVRALGIARLRRTDDGGFQGGLYVGYAPAYREPVVQFTVSFGRF